MSAAAVASRSPFLCVDKGGGDGQAWMNISHIGLYVVNVGIEERCNRRFLSG